MLLVLTVFLYSVPTCAVYIILVSFNLPTLQPHRSTDIYNRSQRYARARQSVTRRSSWKICSGSRGAQRGAHLNPNRCRS
ncbi:hypothetical protein BD311DRAFT_763611 [Dichomitus squalens]|uniref:Uncharacterized protein n=1 Tax=Dichomitus squalens TaxID=114155 RepID=A0A4V2JZQ3_9APHY|nr:hypothetical protein BD311DRAFT_763611 [Dichomitus squalens]